MAKLGILGHATRGKEIIKLLEMLGGKNDNHCCGGFINRIYFINENGYIESCDKMDHLSYFQLSLEEFLEEFPYKVGDKVKHSKINDIVGRITDARWDNKECQVSYYVEWDDETKSCYFVKNLQPYEEETMDKAIKAVFDAKVQCCDIMNDIIKKDMKEIKIDIPAGYEFAGVDDDKQQVVFQKIQPQYPKTYEECCKALMGKTDFQDFELVLTKLSTIYEEDRISPEPPPHISTINALYKLLICRDAYWKIAGEQMGLGKPWKPDYTDKHEKKYSIWVDFDKIRTGGAFITTQMVLTYPTEEMRDAFDENFKELIEGCKELL